MNLSKVNASIGVVSSKVFRLGREGSHAAALMHYDNESKKGYEVIIHGNK